MVFVYLAIYHTIGKIQRQIQTQGILEKIGCGFCRPRRLSHNWISGSPMNVGTCTHIITAKAPMQYKNTQIHKYTNTQIQTQIHQHFRRVRSRMTPLTMTLLSSPFTLAVPQLLVTHSKHSNQIMPKRDNRWY